MKVCEKCDDGYDFSNCNEYEKNYWLIYNFYSETGCGGIEGFFGNCYDNVEDTCDCLDFLYLTQSFQYLDEAIKIYPNHYIEYLSDEDLTNQMNQLDEKYYDSMEKESIQFMKEYLIKNEKKFYDI